MYYFWQSEKSEVVLRIIDHCLVVLAFAIAFYTKSHLLGIWAGLTPFVNYLLIFLLYLLYTNFAFNFFHFSRLEVIRSLFREMLNIVVILSVSSMLVLLTCYLVHIQGISRLLLAIFNVLLFTLLLLRRYWVSRYFQNIRSRGKDELHVLIIGSRERAKQTINVILDGGESNYRVVGCLEPEPSQTGKEVVQGVKIIGSMEDYTSFMLHKVIDEVIFAIPLKKIDQVVDYIRFSEQLGVRVRIMPDWQLHQLMFRPETASINFESLLGVPTLTLSSTPRREVELFAKGLVDYLGALTGLLVTSPLMLAIALTIKFSSPGPLLFRQTRCGLNGRRFTLYKFRTMIADAEQMKKTLEERNEMDGPVFKIRNDPRITRVGRYLRKTSLDELPQLFNVLKGEMSIVGPRPPLPEEVEKYLPRQRRRLSMKPGLTCLWQTARQRNDISFEEWMKMDCRYIDTWSLRLDLKILCRTVGVVLFGQGR